jgi:arylsulfatase A-like enzyme
LRGYKGTLFEGGHRVPALLAWPGTLKPRVESGAGMGMDVLPTLLGLAGLAKPAGIDGADLSGALQGAAKWPERTLHWEYDRQRAVRHGDWKLTVNPRPSLMGPNENITWLANLKDDPGETRNLATERPEILAELQRQMQGWQW